MVMIKTKVYTLLSKFNSLINDKTMIRVVLFEDNKNLRESLSMYLASSDSIWLAGSFSDARNALWAMKIPSPRRSINGYSNAPHHRN